MYNELRAIESFLKIQDAIQPGLQTIAESGVYDESFEYDFSEAMCLMSKNDSYYVGVHMGVSKGVLVPDEEDFVFKIPFEADNCGELLTYDYCEVEVINYEAAKKAGVEKYFAITKFFDTFKTDDGVRLPVYIQEKITPFEEVNSWDADKQYTHYESKANSYTGTERLPLKWINDFIECYSEDQFDELGRFLDAHDINDLHAGNVGYVENEYPVIFDFSGYHDLSADREAREEEW